MSHTPLTVAVPEIEQLEQAIATLEGQRTILGDAVVEAALGPMREKLAALQAQSAPAAQQRKQATVLFADVKGFTAMSEKLDAEDLTELMNALWERLDAAITAYGGRIDKHIGDSVMALWGAEQAGEDDPENAIRAALAMQAELAGFREARGMGLGMRIGINSGPVLVGAVGSTHEFTAMGDTVNTASRLEGAAPVGGVLIGQDTYRLVRGIFDLQTLEPVTVKGKADPLPVYRVQGAKPRAFRMGTRGVAGVETLLVGREGELARLQDGLYSVLEEGRLQMLTVLGEAGVGKSRLLYEFENWMDLQPQVVLFFKGRAFPQGQAQPYALLRDLFAYRFQVGEDEPLAAVRAKLEAGFGEALGSDEKRQMKTHFIGQLLGYDFSQSPHLANVLNDARQIRDRAVLYLVEYFRALSSQTVVAIFLEDLHWADDASLDVVDYLSRALQASRAFVVGLGRPEFLERRPQWGLGQLYQSRLELAPLTRHASRQLLAEILKKAGGAPSELSELVVQAAEGNPFYIEELVKMLMEQGVILVGEQRWEIATGRLAEVHVPPTLTGVLQARLDRLTPEERTTLQQASVVGRVFWEKLVATLGDAPDVAQELSRLQGRELVFQRERSEFQDTREYIFKHALLRDVAYESVLKRTRRRYHELVARWLIEQGGERLGEYLGLIGEHLERAGLAAEAADYLRRAGERAATAYANGDAVAYFSRALALLPETDRERRFDLLLVREQVYDLQGARQAQAGDLATLEELAGQLQIPTRQAAAALRRARFANATGDYAGAITAAQVAIAAAQIARDASTEASAYEMWGRALESQAQYEAAHLQFQGALELARLAGDRQQEVQALQGLDSISWRQTKFAEAAAYGQQALAIAREIGDRRSEGRALNNLGTIAGDLGEYAQTRMYYEQGLAISREIGYRPGEGRGVNNLGYLLQGLGDYFEARGYYEQSLVISQEIGDRELEAITLYNLGAVLYNLGEVARAQACLLRALSIAREIGIKNVEGVTLNKLGDALSALGETAQAQAHLLQALDLRRELDQPHYAAEDLAGLARVALAQGDPAGAQARIEELWPILESNPYLDGAEAPMRALLTAYRVLHAAGDGRAQGLLTGAYHTLQGRAARITDEALRRSFLENVPEHREIVTLWQAASLPEQP